MKHYIVLLLGLYVMVNPGANAAVCQDNTYECLLTEYNRFYAADRTRFMGVYSEAMNKALVCTSTSDMARFLKIHQAPFENPEMDEAILVDTEALILLRPKCFFEGMKSLNSLQQYSVVDRYRLVRRGNAVMRLFKAFSDKPEYSAVAKQLYAANVSTWRQNWKGKNDAPQKKLHAKYKIK